jgi:hypothetical protein
VFQKVLHNDFPNITVWPVLRKVYTDRRTNYQSLKVLNSNIWNTTARLFFKHPVYSLIIIEIGSEAYYLKPNFSHVDFSPQLRTIIENPENLDVGMRQLLLPICSGVSVYPSGLQHSAVWCHNPEDHNMSLNGLETSVSFTPSNPFRLRDVVYGEYLRNKSVILVFRAYSLVNGLSV